MISCIKSPKQPTEGVLMKADMDFSGISLNEGMQKAFLSRVADSGVMLRDNGYPIKGRESMVYIFSGRADTSFTLTWKPVFEKIAESGDLGYTYGFYTRTIKATGEVSKGTYLTIWEKQKDGKWKFVMDTGTEGLPEEINNAESNL